MRRHGRVPLGFDSAIKKKEEKKGDLVELRTSPLAVDHNHKYIEVQVGGP